MRFDDFTGAMFGVDWTTSARRHGVVAERDVRVPMPDGARLSANLWRPDTDGPGPAILSFHPYHQEAQTGPITPAAISSAQWQGPGQERTNASLESGEPTFFAKIMPRLGTRPGTSYTRSNDLPPIAAKSQARG